MEVSYSKNHVFQISCDAPDTELFLLYPFLLYSAPTPSKLLR